LPYEEEKNIFLQQDGFLEKELQKKDALKEDERPINQYWSWDRILRSPYIKQADVLQGLYFFESDFSKEAIKSNFEFYEPFTVHESSLSPCIHAILAAHLGKIEQAYLFYLQTSRLDLDDYNHEVHEGLHITSMAGTWLSVVEGFGGMRVKEGKLYFNPQLPSAWEGLRFNIYFRGSIIGVSIDKNGVNYSNPDQIPIVTETAKSK
jgi:maltose phosphorylase